MKTRILDQTEREALYTAYKQFSTLDELPNHMDLYSTSGKYLGKLTYLTTKVYPLKRDGILINSTGNTVTVELGEGKERYKYKYERKDD